MAKYEVNFSCGHTERIELFGKVSERERKIEYFEERGICSECYKEQKKIEIEVAAEKAGLVATEMTYREYKNKYPTAKTVPGSYNGETKTIVVYVSK